MRDLSDVFKALSDPTRLQVMALLLRHGELCVCDVVQVLGITQSKASRHLRNLLHAGLVRDRREGVWSYYRAHPAPRPEPAAVLQAVGPLLQGADLADLEQRLGEWQRAKAQGRATCADAGRGLGAA